MQIPEVVGNAENRRNGKGRWKTATSVDRTLAVMGVTVLKTPVHAPQANAFCERLIGTIRRECLDFVIPVNRCHVRSVLAEWVGHYNRGRPHSSLGRGVPIP